MLCSSDEMSDTDREELEEALQNNLTSDETIRLAETWRRRHNKDWRRKSKGDGDNEEDDTDEEYESSDEYSYEEYENEGVCCCVDVLIVVSCFTFVLCFVFFLFERNFHHDIYK